MNNSYGWAMSKYLHYQRFKKWLKNVDEFDVMSISEKKLKFFFQKKIENLQKIINVRLVNNAKDFLKYTSKPTYINHKIFGKYQAAIMKLNKL